MRIPILIEPIENGRFRACASDPLAICAEGTTEKEATDLLTAKRGERLATGARLAFVDMPHGAANHADPLLHTPTPTDEWFFTELQKDIAENRTTETKTQLPFPADNLYQTDPAFCEWQGIIAENRRLEIDADSQTLEASLRCFSSTPIQFRLCNSDTEC